MFFIETQKESRNDLDKRIEEISTVEQVGNEPQARKRTAKSFGDDFLEVSLIEGIFFVDITDANID